MPAPWGRRETPNQEQNSKNPCAADSPYQRSDDRGQMTDDGARRRLPRRCSAPAFNLTIALSSELCSSPAWWLWRGRRTRSHPELGREIPQRRWYCVLRRGRVGRCQACQEQQPRPTPLPIHANGPENFCLLLPRAGPARPAATARPGRQHKQATGTPVANTRRGVEQSGSSSGS